MHIYLFPSQQNSFIDVIREKPIGWSRHNSPPTKFLLHQCGNSDPSSDRTKYQPEDKTFTEGKFKEVVGILEEQNYYVTAKI